MKHDQIINIGIFILGYFSILGGVALGRMDWPYYLLVLLGMHFLAALIVPSFWKRARGKD
jgi:hypothetical protein